MLIPRCRIIINMRLFDPHGKKFLLTGNTHFLALSLLTASRRNPIIFGTCFILGGLGGVFKEGGSDFLVKGLIVNHDVTLKVLQAIWVGLKVRGPFWL